MTRRGMMVNLGWVSVDKINDLDKNIDNLETFEINEEDVRNGRVLYDRFSGFAYPTEDYDEDENGYVHEIVNDLVYV